MSEPTENKYLQICKYHLVLNVTVCIACTDTPVCAVWLSERESMCLSVCMYCMFAHVVCSIFLKGKFYSLIL